MDSIESHIFMMTERNTVAKKPPDAKLLNQSRRDRLGFSEKALDALASAILAASVFRKATCTSL